MMTVARGKNLEQYYTWEIPMRLLAISMAIFTCPLVYSQTVMDALTPRPGYYKELKPERYKERVEKMLKADEANPPSKQGVVFVGSATIAGWNLKHYFPQYRTV